MARPTALLALAAALSGAALLVPAAALAWPNGPDEDPCLSIPNDPGYKGQWEWWSFVPGPHVDPACPAFMKEDWTSKPGFRTEEIAIGAGMHVDRAWQRETGDRRVVIAVLDSGVYWDNADLVNKYFLNAGELGKCKPDPMPEPPPGATDFDADGSGWFDVRDYYAAAGSQAAALPKWDAPGNANGMIDPQDLLLQCSDGVDDDGNGYTDDISGWDFFADDNDAYDQNRFGHGNGEARDSTSEGNNGIGDIGVCPGCTALMVRAGDSFVVDANEFAQGVVFAVDSGASVIQEALGSVNNTAFSQDAIEYAYRNGVVVIASAADELAYHHNFPGTNNHTVYVHAVVYDGASADQSTTFLNFSNCTNFGMNLVLSSPGTGCSSQATGMTSGQAGLVYSAALHAGLDPPLSAEEAKQLLSLSVDDIDVNPDGSDPSKFKSGPGWDWHFGYGRNNARISVDRVLDGHLPPEVDIVEPLWFEVVYPDRTPEIPITGRINKRVDGLPARYAEVDWTFEYAIGPEPAESSFVEVAKGTTAGMDGTLLELDVASIPVDLDARIEDSHQNAVTIRLRARAKAKDGTEVLGEMRKGFLLERDDDLFPGFPRYTKSSGEASPIFADLDGDGAEDLVVPLSDGTVHAYKHDGTEVSGFPATMNLRKAEDPANPLHVRNACVFRVDKGGCKATGMTLDPDEIRHTSMMPGAVGDLDQDGTLEIVANTWDGFAYVFEHDGLLREGWPRTVDFSIPGPSQQNLIEHGFFAAPVLWDMDGDSDLEVIAAAMDQHVYVWHDDGSPYPPYPVKVSSDPGQGARIIATPCVGDADGDGKPEIAVGTSEIFGAGGAQNEAVVYLLDGETGEVADGWPQPIYGLTVNTLPIVGRGVVGNPMMADLDYDGTLEISFDTISTQGWIFEHDGDVYRKMNNQAYGPLSNSTDSPAYVLMNNGAIGNVDGKGGLDLVKGTAGFDFAIAFAGGGERKPFDHHVSAWDTDTGSMLEGFPRVMDDWQFFNAPTIADLDNDNRPEVIVGSGGYLVRAWNAKGEQPEGWPKQTGGWIIASAAVGDFDGDQLFEVAITTRDGWLYVWRTPGKAGKSILEWNGFQHDPHNTGNYETDPTPYKTWSGAVDVPIEPEPAPDAAPDAPSPEPSPDAGPVADASSDAGAEPEPAPAPKKKKSGCDGGPDPGALPSLLGPLALAGLALASARRRRRSR